MRLSYSATELYQQCARKYRYNYVDKLVKDETPAALLFGASLDRSLNYVLTRKKHNHIPYEITTKAIFNKSFDEWKGQNELVYFKGEAPLDIDEYAPEYKQEEVWKHLRTIGHMMITTYLEEILPQFKKILSVQQKKIIPNESGDELVLITDFIAEMPDGRVVVFDNKSSSDIKRNYGKNSVKKSTQLAIYSEFSDAPFAGYVALQKKLVEDKVVWTMVIDEVPEELKAQVFQNIDNTLHKIRAEEFPKNEKSCYAFGKKCSYYSACHYGDTTGLIKK